MSAALPLPGLITYCQDREDLILARFLADVEQGFYVDVGACLPVSGSVTKYFYDHLWHGVNIEPQPGYFVEMCRARPRDINLNIGISNVRGKATLQTSGGLSTLNHDTAKIIAAKGEAVFQEIEIALCTLTDVFDAHVGSKTVHFLKIDVETHEKEVLESMDFTRYQPWIVVVESTFPNTLEPLHETWEHLLTEQGYIFALQHTVNRYYIHKHKYNERLHVFEKTNFLVIEG